MLKVAKYWDHFGTFLTLLLLIETVMTRRIAAQRRSFYFGCLKALDRFRFFQSISFGKRNWFINTNWIADSQFFHCHKTSSLRSDWFCLVWRDKIWWRADIASILGRFGVKIVHLSCLVTKNGEIFVVAMLVWNLRGNSSLLSLCCFFCVLNWRHVMGRLWTQKLAASFLHSLLIRVDWGLTKIELAGDIICWIHCLFLVLRFLCRGLLWFLWWWLVSWFLRMMTTIELKIRCTMAINALQIVKLLSRLPVSLILLLWLFDIIISCLLLCSKPLQHLIAPRILRWFDSFRLK